ncbi:hypothetical protein CMUS01_13005 [Colletotrichum musicola]|uniref:Uncharacterized protein n=1 Tax=Colletotrichum musicola TaxID=2175873 RepID=A0A8H6JHA5_9PEZI|nr:hypothetical protein CMUS01_13005 [Colletotrichum musicola]
MALSPSDNLGNPGPEPPRPDFSDPESPPWDDSIAALTCKVLVEFSEGQFNVWLRTFSSGRETGTVSMFVFTGQPRKLDTNLGRGTKFCTLGSRTFPGIGQENCVCSFPLHEYQDVEYVAPVFEITTSTKQEHPSPYVRVPEPGPYNNWPQVHRLALRFDRVVKGEVVSQYYHAHEHIFPYAKYSGSPHSRHLTGPWCTAMGWIAALMNFEWAERPTFDHWALTPFDVTLESLTPRSGGTLFSQPSPKKVQEPPKIARLGYSDVPLTNLYGKEHDQMSIGIWYDTLLPSGRRTCDSCYMSTTKSSLMYCPLPCRDCRPRPIPVSSQVFVFTCEFCQSLGRACTFTPEDYIDLNAKSFTSLGYAKPQPQSIHRQITAEEKRTSMLLLQEAAQATKAKKEVDKGASEGNDGPKARAE